MKIAVTYNDGKVFEHFGHTEYFKVYDVENGSVINSAVLKTDGLGHGALAGFLESNSVDVLICGGIGSGAEAALMEQGIGICSGASGDADEAVDKFLKGELESEGVNCDHHSSGEPCASEGCGGGCGGCGGGCHSITGKNVGKTVRVHYKGTLEDGEQFDSSYDRGEPLEFECGAGMMIKGFDKAVANMEVGQVVEVLLPPEEAYGEKDPNAIITVAIKEMPGTEELIIGQNIYLQNMYGQPFPAVVAMKDDENISFDCNHELAGKTLNFKIELLEVLD